MYIALKTNKKGIRVSLKTSGKFTVKGTVKEFKTMEEAIEYINKLQCIINDIMILELHKDESEVR